MPTVDKDRRDFASYLNSVEGKSESNFIECNSDSNSNWNGGNSNSIPIQLELG